ncbi:MAG: hypothetical protein HKN16_12195 [Saprospiraceae bacterium]|nr:hypothetical protein [Saprospiraceae bacterium]
MKEILQVLASCSLLCLIWACNPDDEIFTDPSAELKFSTDTLTFDTVFTQIGSATRILKIYNDFDQNLLISRIELEGGNGSSFRLNIDGDPVNMTEDLVIPSDDSLYLFAEVTVDPDQPISVSPYVIEDAILFETNGNEQRVVLEAWGQNANYIPDRFSADSISTFTCNGGTITWDDPKPYVIYGIVYYENCEVVLPAGTDVFVHGGLAPFEDDDGNTFFYNDGRLIIGPNARIKIEGTRENPVTFQGDRLEEDFEDVSGQWFGIVLSPGSQGNRFEHLILKNSLLGVVVDSAANLEIDQTQIFNTSSNAIFAQHAEVSATNSLFYNNGSAALRLGFGGDYDFTYCTIGSFGNDQQSVFMDNLSCLDPFCGTYLANDLNATFINSVFFGSNSDQIGLSAVPEAEFNYFFEHCVLRVDDLLDPEVGYPDFFDNANSTLNADRTDPMFFSVEDDDYRLDTLSIAEGKAIPVSGIDVDLDGNERDEGSPDIGCFEYQY